MNLPKIYDPAAYESDIYALWEKSRAFEPGKPGHNRKAYSVVMPPPNANANLHIGFTLTAVLEDIAVRYHRAKGEAALLLPGADHAGFETQSVYEKHLTKQGESRFDYSREELYDQIYDFVSLNRQNFTGQMRRMGVGCDWSRFTFTLDEKIVTRAYATFKKMWDEGLIYRSERLVNFCTFHGTAFADIEVVHREEKGHLWHISYPLTDGSGEVVVATTRPETMFGDVAVAVNPSDERYKHLVGKSVTLPLTNRELPIITDGFVDSNFGSGAVKITPAHDINDYEVGKRHDLPFITVINHEGKIQHAPEQFNGLTVAQARDAVLAALTASGALKKSDDHQLVIGHCYKCDTVIQPLLREQWFVDMQPLTERAISALQANKITFYPEAKKTQLITYLQGLKDWNISRQIAWGIPIPAFQNVDNPEDWIYNDQVNEKTITKGDKTYRRDDDVFDTWFSSGSWPYATLGYPDSDDFKDFYPLSLMETGTEILYPWVGRMIMLGLYVTDEIPFKAVYLHGYVMAEDGSKMSKSIGNVVDPIPVIDMYGSDALRLGIISNRTAAVNRGYDPRKIEDGRNFCNKLWNVARYIEGIVGDEAKIAKPHASSAADNWVLQKLAAAQTNICNNLDEYRFSEAYDTLYHFVWDDVADWYIEANKAEPNKALLAYVLEQILVLAHPFAPFVTETIWQTLLWEGSTEEPSLLTTRIMQPIIKHDLTQSQAFETIQQVITEARGILRALKVTGVTLYHQNQAILDANNAFIARMARLKAVVSVNNGTGIYLTSVTSVTSASPPIKCWLDIDITAARAYSQEIAGQLIKQQAYIAQLQARLANTSYVANAPKQLVAETKLQLSEAEAMAATLQTEKARYEQIT